MKARRSTQGAFLYVFEPGGNRIELFGNSGILQFEPDCETRVWDLQEFATRRRSGRRRDDDAPEFLLYGTPPTPDQVGMVVPCRSSLPSGPETAGQAGRRV